LPINHAGTEESRSGSRDTAFGAAIGVESKNLPESNDETTGKQRCCRAMTISDSAEPYPFT
jgi:hypothetical protein